MSNPQVWYTADPHVAGHRLVSRIRGFINEEHTEEYRGEVVFAADTEAHDAQVAENWDRVVKKDDTVFVVGDISINGKQPALDWMAERPGNKILITGNHDPVHPGFFRNAWKVMAPWREVFVDIQPYYRIALLGQQVLISHLPYLGTGAEGKRDNGEEVEPRGVQWRLPDLGMPLIHGHTHGPERAHLSDKNTPELHVGLDAWDLNLVHQDTVLDWLLGKEV